MDSIREFLYLPRPRSKVIQPLRFQECPQQRPLAVRTVSVFSPCGETVLEDIGQLVRVLVAQVREGIETVLEWDQNSSPAGSLALHQLSKARCGARNSQAIAILAHFNRF
jgi:hypothetical protein